MIRFKSLLFSLIAFTFAVQAAPPPRVGLPPGEVKPSKVFQVLEKDATPDWGVLMLGCPDAWKVTKGKGVKVAVLDTGATLAHPDLKDSYVGSKDFTASATGVKDVQGHGTHCAGSIGARGLLPGVAPECLIYAGKVLDDTGSGGVDEIAAGITYAVKTWEVDVISMSLGGSSADSYMPPAIKSAIAAGVIVVCAAGNEGPGENTEGYPGHYPDSLSVAACDKLRNIANFSSRGTNVFITGPGVDIRSTYKDGQYATMSGTSMATPHIAGVAALWVASHPEIAKVDRPAAFRKALAASTKFTDRTTARGYGFPDAVKVVGTPVLAPPAPKPGIITVGFSDLSAAKQSELKVSGLDVFSMSFGTASKPAPAMIPANILPANKARSPGGDYPVSTDPDTWVVGDTWLKQGKKQNGVLRVVEVETVLAESGGTVLGSKPVRLPLNPVAPAGLVSPGPNYSWRSLPGVGPGWVQDGITVGPDAVPLTAPVPMQMPSACPGGVCPTGGCPQPTQSTRSIPWLPRLWR
jgi:subtilisin family serine protease